MKTILSLFTFVAFTFEAFGQNVVTNGEIQLEVHVSEDHSFHIKIKDNTTNWISVIGPLESGIYHKPQTYWLEAQDASGNQLQSKLPASFGQRRLKPRDLDDDFEGRLFWPKDGPRDYSGPLLELKDNDLYEPCWNRRMRRCYSGSNPGYSGPGATIPHSRMTEIRDPDAKLHTHIFFNTSDNIHFDEYHLRRWFDFETNKTYYIKVKLQPTKDSSVFESNPVLVMFKSDPKLEVTTRFSNNVYNQFFLVLELKNNSTNYVSVMGPIDSTLKNTPQTYWLEAVDNNGAVLPAKLPTSFGFHQLDVKLMKPEFPLQDQGLLYPPDPYHGLHDSLCEPLGPGDNWCNHIDISRWFNLTTGETYSVKVKLQPTKDGPIFESNPVIVKLSDKPQKKQLVPAESIKKSN